MKHEQINEKIKKFIEPYNKRIVECDPNYIIYRFNNDEVGTVFNYDKAFVISFDATLNELRLSIRRKPKGNMSEPIFMGTVQEVFFTEKLNKITPKTLEKALSMISFIIEK